MVGAIAIETDTSACAYEGSVGGEGVEVEESNGGGRGSFDSENIITDHQKRRWEYLTSVLMVEGSPPSHGCWVQ